MLKWAIYLLIILKPGTLCSETILPLRQNVCAYYVSQHERLKSIPRHLLGAISKIESGRLNPHNKKVEAWPWTINVQGQGYFFLSKGEAVEEVKKLLSQGIKSIDVGCMQVNLHHHKNAFTSIEQAFDPKINIDYAAKFLISLKEIHGSWSKAVAHYHSATPAYHIPYRKKVLDTWRKENRLGGLEEEPGPLRGAFWAKERYKMPQSRRADLAQLRRWRQQDPQWRRHETRMAMANLRAKALKTSMASTAIPWARALSRPTFIERKREVPVRIGRLAVKGKRPQKERVFFTSSTYMKRPVLKARGE